MNTFLEKVIPILNKLRSKGGCPYIVGGTTRDLLMGQKSEDIDVEVFKMSREALITVLSLFGEVKEVGHSFGVFKIEGYPYLDIALARVEIKTGKTHRSFKIINDEFLSIEQASLRRDLTMNAIYYEPFLQEFIDPYGGISDIQAKIIRMVHEETFKEDVLRVFRVAQFAARFNFTIERKTKDVCKEMLGYEDFKLLSQERIQNEMMKLWGATNPMNGLLFLKEIGYFTDFDYTINSEDFTDCWLHNIVLFLEQQRNDEVLEVSGISSRNKEKIMQYRVILHKMKDIKDKVSYYFLLEEVKDKQMDIYMLFKTYGCLFGKHQEILELSRNYGVTPLKRIVSGKDLIEAGFTNYKQYRQLLNQSFMYQIQGKEKQEILELLQGGK